jgi:hypothetical protein
MKVIETISLSNNTQTVSVRRKVQLALCTTLLPSRLYESILFTVEPNALTQRWAQFKDKTTFLFLAVKFGD